MKLRTFWRLARSGQLGLLARINRLHRHYCRMDFLGAALRHGVLARLAPGPLSLAELAAVLAPDPCAREGLEAWLDYGVSLAVLERTAAGYAIRDRLARQLVEPANDPAAAMFEEATGLHHALLMDSIERLGAGRPFTLADQSGEVVARSSRLLEPLVFEAIEWAIPARGAVRLLEIGCGSSALLRHAAQRNPELMAVGLELQPAVAAMARENVAGWGLAARIAIETGDVRARAAEPAFDFATLHNNVYYFPVPERPALFAHIRAMLRPGGTLLVTTPCRGGSPAMEILNLWATVTEGCGRLPDREELERQLADAGLTRVRSRSLLPGDRYYAFAATR